MPIQASSTLPGTTARRPAPLPDTLAPDLVALFLGATPHPDIVIPEPRVTLADLAAAARARSTEAGAGAAVLRWDAAGQRFAS
ncbi:hypothetical protein GCM10009839_75970 [Catenulispora yoronensis]|uniref:Uncharacterized protein n=1 Tax=Catenulispora yoronensis TaxID=450799 RepID=A0ABN2V8Y4_9ACTN